MTSSIDHQKPWQKGYALEDLLKIEAKFARYNHFSLSPFSEATKNKIAEWAEKGELQGVTFDDKELVCIAKHPYVRRKLKRDSEIKMFNSGVAFGNPRSGDLIYSHLSGRNETLIRKVVTSNKAQWIYVWREDNALIEWLMERLSEDLADGELPHREPRIVGNKYSTFAEITSVIYVPSPKFGITIPQVCEVPMSERASAITLPIKEWVWKSLNRTFRKRLKEMEGTFQNHYSNYNKDKSWSAFSLRGYSSDPAFYYKPPEMSKKWQKEHPGDYKLQDTSLMRRFPEVNETILKNFRDMGCEIQRVRFMKLGPDQGELERHTDQVDRELGAKPGRVMRFHVPVQTNTSVKFTYWTYDEGEEIQFHMPESHMTYLDIRKPHRAKNGGHEDRIHLVIDVIATSKLVRKLETKGRCYI
jgi:hypothetical protein